jgi:hypothetical protein
MNRTLNGSDFREIMSFITVRYGQNEEKILNPNCLSSVLLSHIKKNCGFEGLAEPIDLFSAETGEVIDLLSKPKEYAKKYLEPRGTYILLKVVSDDSEESSSTFVSLLESSNIKISTNATKAKSRKTKPIAVTTEAARSADADPSSPFKKSGTTPLSATGFLNSNSNLASKSDRKQGSPKKKAK